MNRDPEDLLGTLKIRRDLSVHNREDVAELVRTVGEQDLIFTAGQHVNTASARAVTELVASTLREGWGVCPTCHGTGRVSKTSQKA